MSDNENTQEKSSTSGPSTVDESTSSAAATSVNLEQSSNKQAINRCIHHLKRARNDTEKFAALLMVTKLIKAETLDDRVKSKLFDAIGMEFLLKLLRDDSSDDSCPEFMFKSIAMTILSSFINSSQKKDIFFTIIPDLLRIITDPEMNENNLTIVRDALKCILTISLTKNGRKAIIKEHGIKILVDIYAEENVVQEMTKEILKIIMNSEGSCTWYKDKKVFTKLANHASEEFSRNQNERKFELCSFLTEIMYSMPDTIPKDDVWTKELYQGLSDILLSKLSKLHRDEGLKLACACISSLGAYWVVHAGPKGHQLLLIMVHLSCIEVRMNLENETFEKAVESAPHTIGCYNILEHGIKFLVEGASNFEEKQKQQLYTSLKGTFNAVLCFLKEITEEKVHTSDMPTQLFVCATIRILGAWLAEETAANKSDVYEILPFILGMCRYNFEWNKKQSSEIAKKNCPELPDLLKFLLPGLCHLTAEDEPRLILLNLSMDQFLFEYFQSRFKLLDDSDNTKYIKRIYMTDASSEIDTLVTIISIFMNIVVTSSPETIANQLYLSLLKYLFWGIVQLPTNTPIFLSLIGNVGVLGLMILKHHYMNVKSSDYGIYRFMQYTVRFLWDAHNVEDSRDNATLVISMRYKAHWDDLLELWFLGIHNLTLLISTIPWICEFLMECGWPQNLMKDLKQARKDGIESSLKSTLEDFLIALAEKSADGKKTLIDHEASIVAKTHDMTGLLTALQS